MLYHLLFAAVDAPPDILIFLGRFHPLLVHIPIGFLLVAFLLEIFSRHEKYRVLNHATSFILLLGTISSIMAAICGYFLSLSGGYEEETLWLHQWMGIGVALTALVAYILKEYGNRKTLVPYVKAYFPLFALSMFLMMGAGHYGGSLTHGSDYLTQYMPQPLRTIAGLPPRQKPVEAKPITHINEAVVYRDIIHPIFTARCVSCHNPEKKKGDFRMDAPDQLLKGGEHGESLVPGNAAQSDIVKRVLLPEADENHMPPKGKTQLTKEEVELVKWWINSGASFDKTVAQLQATPDVQVMLTKLGSREDSDKPRGVLATKVPAADTSLVNKMRRMGVLVMPVAQGSNFLQARWQPRALDAGNEPFTLLPKMARQVTWLDWSRWEVAAPSWEVLPAMKNLTRLYLQHSNVTDASLSKVKGLANLEYLNLYGTGITDAGLQQLESLKNLKNLYLWQTKVTPEGIEKLRKKLPALKVDRGWEELPPPAVKNG